MVGPYDNLREEIARGRGGQKKLAGNTYARLEGDTVVIKYHATDIATITPELITLDNGGWFTSTTKERLNSYCLPHRWSIYQKAKKWYLTRNVYPETTGGFTVPYHNGMTINLLTGEIGNVPPPEIEEVIDTATRKMSRKIDAYAKGYTDEALAAFLEDLRSGQYRGDCFYCQMTDSATGVGAGDALGDSGHLMDHVMEGYHMATLAYRAIADSGYRFPDVIFTSGDLARRAIKKYLKKRLLKGVAV